MTFFTNTRQVIGWEHWIFAPVYWLVQKTVSEMTYNVPSATSNSTLSVYLFF